MPTAVCVAEAGISALGSLAPWLVRQGSSQKSVALIWENDKI